jgi:phage terminase small subunit
MQKLLPRQQRFVELLVLQILSATKAAQQAGYAQNYLSAQVVACRLISRYPRVREYLRQRSSEVHGRDYRDADEALRPVRVIRESISWMQKIEEGMLR